ncbi:MAG: isocitrate/isopropylmalate family dehydrogenase, partial [Deltaproteobacteria bacterium]|nr:isocitrate/isopropylmalate family dehydrogenase [Deltaproteobacteria bacterium]
APKYVHKDMINPGSVVLCGAMMFDYLGWKEAGRKIAEAISKTISQKTVTYDLARQMEGGREVKCSEFATAVIANL